MSNMAFILFVRNLGFMINQHHTYNCPVSAVVNDLSLELSSKNITLSEQSCTSIDTGTHALC